MKRRNTVQEDSGYDILGLSRWMALRYLNKWTKYLNDKCTGNPFSLTDHIPIGFGNTQGETCVEVGIEACRPIGTPFPMYRTIISCWREWRCSMSVSIASRYKIRGNMFLSFRRNFPCMATLSII